MPPPTPRKRYGLRFVVNRWLAITRDGMGLDDVGARADLIGFRRDVMSRCEQYDPKTGLSIRQVDATLLAAVMCRFPEIDPRELFVGVDHARRLNTSIMRPVLRRVANR